ELGEPEAARDVALRARWPDPLLARELEAKRGHPRHRLRHGHGAATARDDVHLLASELDTGIVGMHPGHDRDTKSFCNGRAEPSARDTVAAGVERGAGDEQVGSVRTDQIDERRNGVALALVEEVVTAPDGGDDVGGVAQRFLQRLTGPHRSGPDLW